MTPKQQQPKQISLRKIFDTRESNGVSISKSSTSFRMSIRDIKVQPGFNRRDTDTAEHKEFVEHLALCIKNGEDLGLFKVAVQQDGTIVFRSGHTRNEAFYLAREKYGVKDLTVLVEQVPDEVEFKYPELTQLKDNNGRRFSPLKRGEVYSVLVEERNMKIAELAQIEGCSVVAIRNLIRAHQLPDQVKEMIRSEKISYTNAIELEKTHGENLVSFLTGKLESSDADTETPSSFSESQPDGEQLGEPAPSSGDWDGLADMIAVQPVKVPEKKSADLVSDGDKLKVPTKAPTKKPKAPKTPTVKLTGADIGRQVLKGEQLKKIKEIMEQLSTKIEEASVGEHVDPDSCSICVDRELAEMILTINSKLK